MVCGVSGVEAWFCAKTFKTLHKTPNSVIFADKTFKLVFAAFLALVENPVFCHF